MTFGLVPPREPRTRRESQSVNNSRVSVSLHDLNTALQRRASSGALQVARASCGGRGYSRSQSQHLASVAAQVIGSPEGKRPVVSSAELLKSCSTSSNPTP